MNQKGLAQIPLFITIAVILAGVIALGYFWYLPKVNENKNANTNQVVVNTNVNQNQNANLNQNTNGTVLVREPYHWYNENTNNNSNANKVIEVNENLNTNSNSNSSSDKTTKWKTYSNDTWKFSFKYPGEWTTIKDNFPTEIRETTMDEYLGIKGNEVVIDENISYPTLQMYVNPAGWGGINVHKVFYVARENGKFVITSENETGAQTGEWGLPEYYSIRIKEDPNSNYQNALYTTIVSANKGTSSENFDELAREIISTFYFTESINK